MRRKAPVGISQGSGQSEDGLSVDSLSEDKSLLKTATEHVLNRMTVTKKCIELNSMKFDAFCS